MTRQNAGQQQVAFYDVGPGSQADGANIFGRAFRALHNIIAQATGFGITRNIIDCYAALILWRPGDRIFLIEFSRGAYAVRCLAGVIARCGIPVHPKNDPNGILPTDPGSAQELAAYAVKHFYQFTREQNFSTVASQRLSSWKESHGLAVQAGQPHNRTEAISSFEIESDDFVLSHTVEPDMRPKAQTPRLLKLHAIISN